MRGGSHRRGPGAGPQGVQELHETAAAKTANFHLVRAFQDRLPRPQQMAHPGIPLLGRRTEPAKVPHLHEPPRQNVLQEPPQEFLSSQPGDFCQAALPVGPAEAHAIMIHGGDPGGVQGRLLQIPRDICKCPGTAAHFPRIRVPWLGPCLVRNGQVELEVGRLQRGTEPVAHPHCQWFGGHGNVGVPGPHPAGFSQGSPGEEVVDVRVITQIPRLGLQDAGHAQLPAEVPQIGCQICQGSGALAEQQCVTQLGMAAGQVPEFGRHGERDHVVGHRQEARLLPRLPLLALVLPAGVAGPVLEADRMRLLLPTTPAAVINHARLRRPATQDRLRRTPMRRRNRLTEFCPVSRPEPPENAGQGEH